MYFLKDLGALDRLVQKEIDTNDKPGGGPGDEHDDQGNPDDDQGDNPDD